ncbi:hypothetical protein G7Y89_g2620 [Cudoniella acicularis]|uniref:Heterokaryon incompatibility domain-containing protein n=1 Tax=Cudoniella acicularis TaxID=354080 RepID=A0A8H4RT59_9HELO|nr:hypothetical protein G7Y89_g2620 [Cudoniella acicularis]
MFCSQCEKIFDLDIGFRSEVEEGAPVPHHESYSALCRAARAGCSLCQLVTQKHRAGGDMESESPLGARYQITFEVFHDTVRFKIPMRIESGCARDEYDFGEDEVTIYLSTDESGPLASLFTWRPLSDDSSSDGCFAVASKWIQNCLDTHDECPKQLSPLPSRVIDVGDDNNDPFLHISNGECRRWLSLSHCWGTQQIFTTTLSNLESHQEKVPMDRLPQTFRDSIFITRQLGCQYLWIDSLCIIQDSHEDWEKEAKQMARIYENALVTISAEVSEGAHKGIFKSVKSRRLKSDSFVLPCYSRKRGISGSVYVDLRNANSNKNIISDVAPLQTRAWVLQEQALSVRKLHYNDWGLSWACQDTTGSETTPWLKLSRRTLFPRGLYKIPYKPLPSRLDFEFPDPEFNDDGSLAWWYHQVNDYMTRGLTVKKDRFPAISAMAREFSKRTGYHYAAGIWVEDFARGLVWKGTRSNAYLEFSPSWSWACAEFSYWAGPSYQVSSLVKHGNDFGAELIDIATPVKTDEYLSPGLPMTLTLRAWCKEIRDFSTAGKFYPCPNTWTSGNLPVPPGAQYLRFRATPPFNNIQDEDTLRFHPDIPLDAGNAQEILEAKHACVLRVSEFSTWEPGNRHNAHSEIWALLLEPIAQLKRTYRRIGLVTIPSRNTISNIEGFSLKTVDIV